MDHSTLLQTRQKAFGKNMQDLRVQGNVSLQELVHLTRISLHLVEALEAGEFEKLPGEVFGRGFIRTICKLLNVPSQELLEEFRACYEQGAQAAAAKSHKDLLKPKGGKSFHTRQTSPSWAKFQKAMVFSYRRILVPVCIGILLLFAIAHLFKPAPSVDTPKEAASSPSPDPVISPEVLPSSAALPVVPPPAEPPAEPSKTPVESTQAVMQPTSNPEALGDAVSTEPSPGLVELYVKAPVTIKHRMNQDTYQSKEYTPGEYRFSFDDKLDFYIFDVAAVDVRFNHQPLGNIGKKGQQRKMSFYGKKQDTMIF